MKMFGSLTRVTEEWHPHRLLCRRFDVPDPYPKVWLSCSRMLAYAKSGIVGLVTKRRPATQLGEGVANAIDAVIRTNPEAVPPALVAAAQSAGGTLSANQGPVDAAAQEAGVVVPTLHDESMIAQPKPDMDIFKAIFCDDSVFV